MPALDTPIYVSGPGLTYSSDSFVLDHNSVDTVLVCLCEGAAIYPSQHPREVR